MTHRDHFLSLSLGVLALVTLASVPAAGQPPLDVTWTEITPPFARTSASLFGNVVRFDGSHIAVASDGRIDVYAWDGSVATFEGSALPGAEDSEAFGAGPTSYAGGFDLAGDVIVAGAPDADSARGTVYVFERQSDGSWLRVRRDSDMDATCCGGGLLAGAVSIDGPRAALGASYYAGGLGAFVLLRADASGDLTFTPGHYSRFTTSIGSLFGAALAVHGADIAVTNLFYGEIAANSGAVQLFHDTGTSLTPGLTIVNPTSNPEDRFGAQVALDDDYVYATASADDTAGSDAGAMYVIQRDGTLVQTVLGSRAYDRLGSLSIDGDWMILGAPAPMFGGESAHVGSVVLLRRDASGTWQDRGRIRMFGDEVDTRFGGSIAIRGHVAVVGATGARASGFANAGRVWVAQLSEPDGGACADDGECTHGHCVAGICCNTACAGSCDTCGAGTCVPTACDDAGNADAGTDADAAMTMSDASAPRDAAAALDTGRSDAARVDAAHSADAASTVDAGAVPRIPLSCTCRVSSGASSHSPLALGSLLLACLARVVRRRER